MQSDMNLLIFDEALVFINCSSQSGTKGCRIAHRESLSTANLTVLKAVCRNDKWLVASKMAVSNHTSLIMIDSLSPSAKVSSILQINSDLLDFYEDTYNFQDLLIVVGKKDSQDSNQVYIVSIPNKAFLIRPVVRLTELADYVCPLSVEMNRMKAITLMTVLSKCKDEPAVL